MLRASPAPFGGNEYEGHMTQPYGSFWDTDDDSDAFDRECEEWGRRDWGSWLKANLSFPFEVKREEDMEENPFDPDDGPNPRKGTGT